MGSEFLVYLQLGVEHITDLRGYDHILFIVALTAMYAPREWLRVLVLVTAFTAGHTITLVLSTLNLLRIPSDLVEFLIPITILAASLLNAAELRWGRRTTDREAAPNYGPTPGGRRDTLETVWAEAGEMEPRGGRITKYGLALGFGLIHGLGFSNFLRAALGAESSLAVPLLAFNLGLEAGQILIVGGVVTATGLATGTGVPRRGWTWFLSGATGLLALGLAAGWLPL